MVFFLCKKIFAYYSNKIRQLFAKNTPKRLKNARKSVYFKVVYYDNRMLVPFWRIQAYKYTSKEARKYVIFKFDGY